jgi:hypothetical protein
MDLRKRVNSGNELIAKNYILFLIQAFAIVIC